MVMKKRYKPLLDEYFPTKKELEAKNDQGKSYNDRTDKQTNKQTDIENYNIDD